MSGETTVAFVGTPTSRAAASWRSVPNHVSPRPLPARRQGRRRHRRLLRPRRRVRRRPRRGGRRRRDLPPAAPTGSRRPPSGSQALGRRCHRRHRRRRAPRGLHARRRGDRRGARAASTCWSTTPASAPPCPPRARRRSEFRRVIDVNLNGSYWMAQACGRVMEPGSSIVNIGSVLGQTTAALPQAAYASSKAAIIGLTRDLAHAVDGPQGHPRQRARAGLLPDRDDRAVPRRLPRGDDDPRARRAAPATRRSWSPRCCSWPATPSSYVTGVVLPVDGGMLTT